MNDHDYGSPCAQCYYDELGRVYMGRRDGDELLRALQARFLTEKIPDSDAVGAAVGTLRGEPSDDDF